MKSICLLLVVMLHVVFASNEALGASQTTAVAGNTWTWTNTTVGTSHVGVLFSMVTQLRANGGVLIGTYQVGELLEIRR